MSSFREMFLGDRLGALFVASGATTLGVVPAQAGTHNPWRRSLKKNLALVDGAEALRRMGPRLRGDDPFVLQIHPPSGMSGQTSVMACNRIIHVSW